MLKLTGAARINYAILGNQEPALHAHVIPRYADEPDKLRTSHPWAYNWEAAPLFDRATYLDLAEGLLRAAQGDILEATHLLTEAASLEQKKRDAENDVPPRHQYRYLKLTATMRPASGNPG